MFSKNRLLIGLFIITFFSLGLIINYVYLDQSFNKEVLGNENATNTQNLGQQNQTNPVDLDDVVYSPNLSIIGKYIINSTGHRVHLVGSSVSLSWSVDTSSIIDNTNLRPEMFEFVSSSGGNLIIICINSELFGNPTLNNIEYKENIDAVVNLCEAFDLFFIFKLQGAGEFMSFSSAGNNYLIAETEPYRSRAIKMFVELCEVYSDNPHFAGISLLNEPYYLDDFSKWDAVVDYYNDVIDEVTKKSPDTIFFVQPPIKWGSGETLLFFLRRGLISRSNVVYEYHEYYHNKLTHSYGKYYSSAIDDTELIEAREKYDDWYLEYIISFRDTSRAPVACFEFGVWSTLPEEVVSLSNKITGTESIGGPDPNWYPQILDQMSLMNDYEIHWSIWRCYYDSSDRNGGIPQTPYDMFSNWGKTPNRKGVVFTEGVP